MPSTDLSAETVRAVAHAVQRLAERIAALFLSPESSLSIWSLACALTIAIVVCLLRRRPGRRAPRLRVWLRALFPRRILRAPSTRADVGMMLLNTFAAGALFSWAIFAGSHVAEAVRTGLAAVFGARAATGLPGPVTATVATLALFLAYDFAYWLDHFLSHKIPFLWAFHKTHHTAEVLTPLTNFRVHPVDSVVFGNISGVIIGGTAGLLAWAFGGAAHEVTVNGSNLLLVVLIFTLAHLQHSHMWIATTGVWGRIVLSPAHHQIHHSDNPIHFDRNFGSGLAIWDWMFGVLHMPRARRETIRFGLGAPVERPHSVTGTLIAPFADAAKSLLPKGGQGEPSNAAAATATAAAS